MVHANKGIGYQSKKKVLMNNPKPHLMKNG